MGAGNSNEGCAMNAWSELQQFLETGERIEAIVFGNWGGGGAPPGYLEPTPPPVPVEVRGKLLAPSEAEPLMRSWSFLGDYGTAECYAVRIWTDRRVIWVTQYDGSTMLDSAPRNPRSYALDDLPDMPGGG